MVGQFLTLFQGTAVKVVKHCVEKRPLAKKVVVPIRIPAVTVTRQDDDGHDWVRRDSLLALLDWYAKTGAPSEHLPGIGGVQRALRSDQKARRAVARKHRWTIAYRQQYCCALCNQLLHPHSFEIDHKQELRDGGKDALDNLQALCSNCHARKTRTWAHGKPRGKARGKARGTSGAAAL